MAIYNPGALESLAAGGGEAFSEILQCWTSFCAHTNSLLNQRGEVEEEENEMLRIPFDICVATLCRHFLVSLVEEHFLQELEESFKRNAVHRFWQHFEAHKNASVFEDQEDLLQEVLTRSLKEICSQKTDLEKCLLLLNRAIYSFRNSNSAVSTHENCKPDLLSRYQLMVTSVLLATLPQHFPVILRFYFKKKLEELNTAMAGDCGEASEAQGDAQLYSQPRRGNSELSYMEIDDDQCIVNTSEGHNLVKSIGNFVRDLRNIGFTSMAEDAYASAIFFLLKTKVNDLAGEDYRIPVLGSIKDWIQGVPLKFLRALLVFLGDSVEADNSSPCPESPLLSRPSCCPGIENPSDLLVRWQLRLEYFAYETLQDLRIGKLFEIIVDYPDSCPAIDDLKQCLEYTGQHSKLVDSFISSLKYRLLTAGASTNDILHQYVSTIKALRTIDPSGVFLEAVGEPIRDYLKGRKDTIKCIVTMLTDGGGGSAASGTGNAGDSLLEELNRDAENQEGTDFDDDIHTDDRQAWINAERWEPDPVEADPLKGSRNRRRINILEMMVNVVGSKDQLVNEYRITLAEKLLNKFDYDIDSEIRTLELLKIHFGEISMQKCEIMLNDLIDSKRTNANIKATIGQLPLQSSEQGEILSMEYINATIISLNFWPPIQEESLHIPSSVDQLLSDYAKRFHEVKTPRKLVWKKNLGMVKLELLFEGRNIQFTVTPAQAAIIMQFQEQKSWTSKNLAASVGMPVDVLNRRISFWISKGILVESSGTEADDHVFTVIDDATDGNRNNILGDDDEVLGPDDEGETSVASVEEQLRKEMTIYEKFIIGMLTNFGSMQLDRIHNTLKMFCVAEPAYDKSLQQLQSFLSGLVTEEKLEMRDGMYLLKK